MTVEHIKDLRPDPENRRKHNPRNIGMVVDSLQAVGAARSIVIDEEDRVLAGNGVVEGAAEAGITKVQVVEADGNTLVAVRRRGLSAEQKRALAIYDNRTGELAEWNAEQFRADVDAGMSLQPWFTEEEAAALLRKAEGRVGLTDPDSLPELRATGIVAGDLFELGRHRLMCGDSTSQADVRRLMGDLVPFLMVTDPPYGIRYEPNWRRDSAHQQGKLAGKHAVATGNVANDDRTDWSPTYQLFPGQVAYVWHAGLFAAEVAASLCAATFIVRAQIIWRKPQFVISRGHYHGQHEPCWYAVRKNGTTAKWCGDRTQSTVWDIAGMAPFGRSPDDADEAVGHGTQKPIECMERPIRNHGGKDDVVYEPFSGSGTTLIAAERQDRACLAMEITPAYVQMAIDRWEAFTGRKAVKVGEAVRA